MFHANIKDNDKKNFKPETSPVTLYNPRVMSIEYSHKKPL